MNSEFIRLSKLENIAENDSIYQVWYCSYQDNKDAFSAFANSQTETIRNMLYAYAEGGRMAMQRKVDLACQYMQFSEEESHTASCCQLDR